MISSFRIIPIAAPLAGYVERIFVMETSGKFPTADLKLIVPNACPKLVLPFKNGLSATSKEWAHDSTENSLTFIGVSDLPASVDFLQDSPAGSITVEFKPLGAYRFAGLNWSGVANRVHSYTEIDTQPVVALEQRLMNEERVSVKVALLQQFLIRQLSKQAEDPIFKFCVQKILQSKGRISIAELERLTGYSSRWLNLKFHSRIGLSPKALSSVIRFQQYYHAVTNHAEAFFLEKQFYHYYHDQSHFIRDFKRFTGHSPAFLSRASNDYDRFFYKG